MGCEGILDVRRYSVKCFQQTHPPYSDFSGSAENFLAADYNYLCTNFILYNGLPGVSKNDPILLANLFQGS
jgi:hypothetical protein